MARDPASRNHQKNRKRRRLQSKQHCGQSNAQKLDTMRLLKVTVRSQAISARVALTCHPTGISAARQVISLRSSRSADFSCSL